jgi:hypothetical protein
LSNFRPTISPDNRELVHQLLDDVAVMSGFFPRPSPSQIRTTLTPILRRWIIEPTFFIAERLIRPNFVEFHFRTSPQEIKLAKAGIFEHWMAIIVFDTVGLGTSLVASKYREVDGTTKGNIDFGHRTSPIAHRANEFFRQKMFFWKENFYNRDDIIKWNANALGGVHLDFRRAAAEPHINEIKNYFGVELRPNNIQLLVGREISEARADPARRQNIYDAIELVVLDTARIFAKGVESSQASFQSLLR